METQRQADSRSSQRQIRKLGGTLRTLREEREADTSGGYTLLANFMSRFGLDFRTGIEYPIVKLLDYAADDRELETNNNPFAVVVLAHLKKMESRQAPEDLRAWKMRLAKQLQERGLSIADARKLFPFIDWLMMLPRNLEQQFQEELHRYEQEKRMPYIPTFERLARTEELLARIEVGLNIKFGVEGLQLMPELNDITDIEMLRSIRQAISTASSPDELRRLWAPKRQPKKGRRT